jgi:hypothetical protein
MLFAKKTKFSITEKQLKEEVTDENGEVLVKINLRYPEIKCSKKDVLFRNCAKLYPKMAEGFCDYAKKDLKNAALKSKKEHPEDYSPFSAVMKWENVFESERFLCFITDISVGLGKGIPETDRKIQIWEREFGTVCRFPYFFENEVKKIIAEEFLTDDTRKAFDKELFALTKDGFEFHIRCKNGYRTFLLPFSLLKEKSLLKIEI